MAETANTDETTTTTTSETTTDKTFTQADLDRIVGERVARERAKFSDYDSLKSSADELAELKAAQLSENERLQKERDDANTAAETAKAEAAATLLEAQRLLVASKAGLPDELGALLKGDTKEELEAHAETLKAFIKPSTEETHESVTPEGQRREQPNGLTRDQIRKLAKENPRKFNAMVDKGEISLSDL